MRFATLLTCVVLAACGSSTDVGTQTPTVTGSWSGVIANPAGGSGLTLAMNLSQTGSTITGAGTANQPNDPPPGIYTVTGTVTGTAVEMTFNIQPQQYNGQTVDANEPPARFSGTLTATTMTGLANKAASLDGGSGITNAALTLTKK